MIRPQRTWAGKLGTRKSREEETVKHVLQGERKSAIQLVRPKQVAGSQGKGGKMPKNQKMRDLTH